MPFEPRFDVLPDAQRELWRQLRPVCQIGFVLYGGTAIALQLGHRQSVDFDFFCDQPLNKSALAQALPFTQNATVLQDQANTWTLLVNESKLDNQAVKLSFFGTIGFGRYGQPQWTRDGVMLVASLDDLMATKLKVILQRVEAKDYMDIAAMLRAQVSLASGLAHARAMFGTNFQPSESLKALTWHQGGDLHELSQADKRTLIQFAAGVHKLPIAMQLSPSLI